MHLCTCSNDVPPGAYLLEVISNSWSYPKVHPSLELFVAPLS
jgi:hypothetical protein